MKLYLFFLLFASAYLGAYAELTSDSTSTRKNIIKLNPLSLAVGDGSLFYERVLSRRSSLVGGLGLGSDNFYYSKAPSPGRFDYRRLTLEYRHYLGQRHRAPMGLYWGLYTRYAHLRLEDYLFDDQGEFIKAPSGSFVQSIRRINVLLPGAVAGVQAVVKRLAIDVFLGLQYQLPSSGPPLRPITPLLMSKQRLAPRYGVTVGFQL